MIKAPKPGDDPVEIRADGTLLVAVAARNRSGSRRGRLQAESRVRDAGRLCRRHTIWKRPNQPRNAPNAPAEESSWTKPLANPAMMTTRKNGKKTKVKSLLEPIESIVVEGNYGIDAITHCCSGTARRHVALGRRPVEGLIFRPRMSHKPTMDLPALDRDRRRGRCHLRVHRRRVRQ